MDGEMRADALSLDVLLERGESLLKSLRFAEGRIRRLEMVKPRYLATLDEYLEWSVRVNFDLRKQELLDLRAATEWMASTSFPELLASARRERDLRLALDLIEKEPFDNECTAFPFWGVALKTRYGMALLHGLWFSREQAETFFENHRYRFPKKALVYGFSGTESDVQRLYEAKRGRAREARDAKEIENQNG